VGVLDGKVSRRLGQQQRLPPPPLEKRKRLSKSKVSSSEGSSSGRSYDTRTRVGRGEANGWGTE